MPKRKAEDTEEGIDKKLKVEASEPLIELSPLEKLPEHVLEKIVNKLPNPDILTMFLVSKQINGILSNSASVMSNFDVIVPSGSGLRSFRYGDFFGIRKYSMMKLQGTVVTDIKITLAFLKPYAGSVKYLTLIHPVMEVLTKILPIFTEIETLTVESRISSLNIYTKGSAKKPPFALPKLIKLQFTPTGMLNLFKNCQLKSYEMEENYDGSKTNRIFLKDFLQTQSELEHLSLNEWHLSKILEGGGLDKLKFNLKSFTLADLDFYRSFNSSSFKANLAGFVNKHKESLTELNLEMPSPVYFEYFTGFQNVKKLTVLMPVDWSWNWRRDNFHDIASWNFMMDSVEELTLVYAGFESLAKNFPNLNAVKLEWCTIKQDFLIDLPHLERLNLKDCYITQTLTMSKLKSFTIYDNDYTSSQVHSFNMENNKLEELVIVGTIHVRLIENLLDHKDTQLAHLKFIKGTNSEAISALIDRNLHKIKRLAVVEDN